MCAGRHIPACTAVCTHAHDHSPCPSQFSFWDRAKLQYGGVLITGAGSLCFCHVLKSNSARKPEATKPTWKRCCRHAPEPIASIPSETGMSQFV